MNKCPYDLCDGSGRITEKMLGGSVSGQCLCKGEHTESAEDPTKVPEKDSNSLREQVPPVFWSMASHKDQASFLMGASAASRLFMVLLRSEVSGMNAREMLVALKVLKIINNVANQISVEEQRIRREKTGL